jgi:hypothetical protein
MCLASVALRFAFPHQAYIHRETHLPTTTSTSMDGSSGSSGRVVTMQTISNNLKETMNPKDIMHGKTSFFVDQINVFSLDAIHNFHPQYRDYTQYSAQVGRFLLVPFLIRSIFVCVRLSVSRTESSGIIRHFTGVWTDLLLSLNTTNACHFRRRDAQLAFSLRLETG